MHVLVPQVRSTLLHLESWCSLSTKHIRRKQENHDDSLSQWVSTWQWVKTLAPYPKIAGECLFIHPNMVGLRDHRPKKTCSHIGRDVCAMLKSGRRLRRPRSQKTGLKPQGGPVVRFAAKGVVMKKRKPQPCYSLFMHNIICIYKYIYIYRLNDAHENEELHISLWDTTVGLGVYIWPHCRVEALDSQLHQQKHQHKQGKWGTIQIQ